MDVLVIIPTYNEKDNIARMCDLVLNLKFQEKGDKVSLLVIDDNSPDNTGNIVSEKIESKNYKGRLFLIKRIKKLGLGTAYCEGFKFAIENGYDYVITMDCDFSHDPLELPNFIMQMQQLCCLKGGIEPVNASAAAQEKKAWMIVGSRYKDGIRVINWGMSRLLISYFANVYAMFVTGLKITDLTGGFNMYDVNYLKKINLNSIRSKGYAFQIEMKYRVKKCGCELHEMPIIFYERTKGKSKMSKSIIFEAFFMVLRLRLGLFKN
jgi:dolichol-phosphate mannosyltransferase